MNMTNEEMAMAIFGEEYNDARYQLHIDLEDVAEEYRQKNDALKRDAGRAIALEKYLKRYHAAVENCLRLIDDVKSRENFKNWSEKEDAWREAEEEIFDQKIKEIDNVLRH